MSDTLELAKYIGFTEHAEESANDHTRIITYYECVAEEIQAFRDACVKEATEELQARVAMQDEALKDLTDICVTQVGADYNNRVHDAFTKGQAAISATSEDVAAWQEKQLAPLRREVAMLVAVLRGVRSDVFIDWEPLDLALDCRQATAEAYEKEVAAKALEDAADRLRTVTAYTRYSRAEFAAWINTQAAELRGETK